MHLDKATEKFIDMVEHLEDISLEEKDSQIKIVQKYGSNLLDTYGKTGRKMIIDYIKLKMISLNEYMLERHIERDK